MATVEKRRELAAGGGLREALLADLPVTERRLEVAGIATMTPPSSSPRRS